MCYGSGKFVAVARDSNEAAYSIDGITWTAATLPSSASWWSVCYGSGKFVAVAYRSNKAAYADAFPSIVEQLCGAGMVRMQEMSYVGTGTYGSSNPTMLTFDFAPKVVLVHNTTNGLWHMIAVSGASSVCVNEYAKNVATLSWSGKSVAFYAGSASQQLNGSGTTYKVVALG